MRRGRGGQSLSGAPRKLCERRSLPCCLHLLSPLLFSHSNQRHLVKQGSGPCRRPAETLQRLFMAAGRKAKVLTGDWLRPPRHHPALETGSAPSRRPTARSPAHAHGSPARPSAPQTCQAFSWLQACAPAESSARCSPPALCMTCSLSCQLLTHTVREAFPDHLSSTSLLHLPSISSPDLFHCHPLSQCTVILRV